MKVNSVRGMNPEAGKTPLGPGIKNQTDITNRKMPREDLTEVVMDTEMLPGLILDLCGKESDREKSRAFIYNTLRIRPLIQDWVWYKSKTMNMGNVKWQKLCSGKDMKNYNLQTICEIVSDQLSTMPDVAVINISNDQGISLGTSTEAIVKDPILSLYYKKTN